MLAENEGHGFQKKENIDQYQNAIVQFLQKNLVGESANPSATFAECVDYFAKSVGNSAKLLATSSQVVANKFSKVVNTFRKGSGSGQEFTKDGLAAFLARF